MIKFLILRQFICPLSLFLKEIPFASLTNAIDMKIERVLTGFLIGWTICFSQSKSSFIILYQARKVSGLYWCVRGTKPGKWAVMYLYVRGTKPGKCAVMYWCVRGTKPGKWAVMHLYVRGTKPGKWAVMYLCVRGTKPGKVMYLCVRGIKPGKWEVMYLCVRGIKPGKWAVMYLCVEGIDFAFFLQFFYCILELFRQHGISLFFILLHEEK
jgi:hypothetical protein